jgi:hypothetical protein
MTGQDQVGHDATAAVHVDDRSAANWQLGGELAASLRVPREVNGLHGTP